MRVSTACLCLLALTATVAASAQSLELVHNGKSRYSIVLAPNASAPVKHGATEIQQAIKAMSGAELPIVTEAAGTAGAPAYAIQIETDPKLEEEELNVHTQGTTLTISGGGKRGALYGCYTLLENVLGCRWYNSRVSYFPKRSTISIRQFHVHEKPGFEYREPYYTEAFDRDWALRNRMNGNYAQLDESVGGKVSYGAFVHTFNILVPPGRYFDVHPEYFSMIKGQRTKANSQLCLTNPEVLQIAIERVKELIALHPTATIFSVSQNDGYGQCECPNCKEVEREEGSPSGLVLRFANAVADAIAKEHPNVLIDTLAYQWSEAPPKHVRPHPNVRIRLAPIGACFSHPLDKCDANPAALANLEAWGHITHQLYIWHYGTNFTNYLQPFPDLDEIAGDIPLFRKNGVVGVFYEGDYAPGGGGEMAELKSYLIAKLLWNPAADAAAIIDDYVRGVYGKAAPNIVKWLTLLHDPAHAANVHAHINDPPTAAYLSPATLAAGVTLFDEAEKLTADDPTASAEVRRARLALEYVQLMTTKPDAPEYAPLARTVAAKIREYGITQAREAEPVATFLARIGQ